MNRVKFFDVIPHQPFDGAMSAPQVAGVTVILDAWDKWRPLSDPRFIAYSLATAFHETARTMRPIEEFSHGHGHPYGLPAGPWHQAYYGRGFVQTTWLANYEKATTRLRALNIIGLDVDLAKTPALAMRPDIAAAIMILGMVEGWFSGKRLADYFNAKTEDFIGARHIINGTDKNTLIAGYATAFRSAILRAA
jgi:putative chitinase